MPPGLPPAGVDNFDFMEQDANGDNFVMSPTTFDRYWKPPTSDPAIVAAGAGVLATGAWAWQIHQLPDDGRFGTGFYRLGPAVSNLSTPPHYSPSATHIFFHPEKQVRFRFKFRSTWTQNDWRGIGLGYCGEFNYGWTGLKQEPEDPNLGFAYAEYNGSAALLDIGYPQSGRILTVDNAYNPAGWPGSILVNGEHLTGHVIASGPPPYADPMAASIDAYVQLTTEYPRNPFALYWMGNGSGGTLDVADLRISAERGSPMWGALDYNGWDAWNRQDAGYYGGWESTGRIGGLGPTDNLWHYQFLGTSGAIRDGWMPVTDFGAQSPVVVPQVGWRYGTLRFAPVNHGNGDTAQPAWLRIYVRDADTYELVPDTEIPGNSTGLVATATALTAGRFVEPGTRLVSLANVSAGRRIYLDVQGHTDPALGSLRDDQTAVSPHPRLGGVWISFDPALSARVISRGAAVTIGGNRRSGSSVTVTP